MWKSLYVLTVVLAISASSMAETRARLSGQELIIEELSVTEVDRILDVPKGLTAEEAYALVNGEEEKIVLFTEFDADGVSLFPVGFTLITKERIIFFRDNKLVTEDSFSYSNNISWLITGFIFLVPAFSIAWISFMNIWKKNNKFMSLLAFYLSTVFIFLMAFFVAVCFSKAPSLFAIIAAAIFGFSWLVFTAVFANMDNYFSGLLGGLAGFIIAFIVSIYVSLSRLFPEQYFYFILATIIVCCFGSHIVARLIRMISLRLGSGPKLKPNRG